MRKRKTAIDLCIDWNREKARRAKEPRDRDRYEDNIKNLEAFQEATLKETRPDASK